VKLLLDQNLSFRLISAVGHNFPGSRHLRDVGLASADDDMIWEYAKQHGFAIVTLDSDFHELSLLRGWPPKIVWLRIGNTATAAAAAILLSRAAEIAAFLVDPDDGCLEIAG